MSYQYESSILEFVISTLDPAPCSVARFLGHSSKKTSLNSDQVAQDWVCGGRFRFMLPARPGYGPVPSVLASPEAFADYDVKLM